MSKLDFEKRLESDFIAVISANTDIATAEYSVRKWRDSEQKKKYPVILIQVSDPKPVTESVNNAPLYSAIVEIGAKTYLPDDKSRSVVYNMLKYIRDTLFASTVKTSLTAQGNYKYLDIDIESGVYEGDFDNVNTLSLTLTAYFHNET